MVAGLWGGPSREQAEAWERGRGLTVGRGPGPGEALELKDVASWRNKAGAG